MLGRRVDINVSEVHLSPSGWKSLLEMDLVVNENIFSKTQCFMASIGVKLCFCNVSEVLYCVTIEEWKVLMFIGPCIILIVE